MTSNNSAHPKKGIRKVVAPLVEIFGLSWKLAFGVLFFIVAVLGVAIYFSVHSAPPTTIYMMTGLPGSVFETNAIRYSNYLSKNVGLTLKIIPSQGSIENLKKLNDPNFRVDVAFVQGGLKLPPQTNVQKKKFILESLGTVFNQPLLVFYRGSNDVTLLSQFAGKRLAIGSHGSGTRALSKELLMTNGIVAGGSTTLLDVDADQATQMLLSNQIDAAFMTGDSASPAVMKQLLRADGIKLMSFVEADAYARRFAYLNRMTFPRGGFDLGKDIPPHDVDMVGPPVELIARSTFHPALVDQLLEAAKQVNGTASLFRRQNEFPSMEEHEYPISNEAERWKKTGKTFLYSNLPFWLASIVHFIIVAFVPSLIVIIPGLKLIPALFKLRIKLIFYRWYRALMNLERELKGPVTPEKIKIAEADLEHIDNAVTRMKVPPSFAGDYYSLRTNVDFVRAQLEEVSKASGA